MPYERYAGGYIYIRDNVNGKCPNTGYETKHNLVNTIYEIFNLFSSHLNRDTSNTCLKSSFINLMKILIPFTPHLANECLEQLNEKNMDNWPEIDKTSISSQKIKVAVQIDGKTREVVQVTKDLSENQFLGLGTIFLCAFIYVLYRYMVIICTTGKVFLTES